MVTEHRVVTVVRLGVAQVRFHRIRAAATSASVLLTVAFATSAFVVTATSRQVLTDTGARRYAGIDLVVRSTDTLSTPLLDIREPLPGSTARRVGRVHGVAASTPELETTMQVLDADGWPVGGNGRGTVARNWLGTDPMNPYRLVAGRGPRAPDEIVLDAATAAVLDARPGDGVALLDAHGTRTARLVGVARLGDTAGEAGTTVVLVTLDEMRRLTGRGGAVDAVLVRLAPGADPARVAAAVTTTLDDAGVVPEVEVVDRARLEAEAATGPDLGSRFLQSVLVVLTVLAGVVALVVIASTFGVVVTQRTRELALLRVVGAGRAQVAGSVVVEAIVAGIVASAVGVGGGVGLARIVVSLLGRAGVNVPTGPLAVPFEAVLVPFLLGVLGTVIGASRAAWRAAQVTPLSSLAVRLPSKRRLHRRALSGAGLLVAATAGLIVGGRLGSAWLVGVATVVAVAGVAVATPWGIVQGATLVGRTLVGRLPTPERLAVADLERHPFRAASSITALSMGVLSVAAVAFLGSSAAASVDASISRQVRGDFVLQNRNLTGGEIPRDVATRLRADPAVAAVSEIRLVPVRMGASPEIVASVDGARVGRLLDVGVEAGTLADLDADGIALSQGRAESLHATIGSRIPVELIGKDTRRLRVVAIYRDDVLIGDALVDHAFAERAGSHPPDMLVLVAMHPGPTVNERKQTIQRAIMPYYPAVAVLDVGRYKAAAARQIERGLGLITVLLVLAVTVALAGVANTMVLSVVERRREFGLLRAVGMSREEVRRMVRVEAVVVTVVGTLIGIVLAFAGSRATVAVFADGGLDVFSVPVRTLVGIVSVAVIAGSAAARAPIRRLERMTVTETLGE